MSFSKITIKGYRGFASESVLKFAIPNDRIGSGLTVVVGANNSGKSTIFESIRAISQITPSSFSEGKKNKAANESICISLFDNVAHPNYLSLKTLSDGGSETEFCYKTGLDTSERSAQSQEEAFYEELRQVYSLQARRGFSPYFSNNQQDRDTYIRSNQGLQGNRASSQDVFSYRLVDINKDNEQKKDLMKK